MGSVAKWTALGFPVIKYRLDDGFQWCIVKDMRCDPDVWVTEKYCRVRVFSIWSAGFDNLKEALDWCEAELCKSGHEKLKCKKDRIALGLPRVRSAVR
jgi:hypothetical protein